MPSFFTHLRNFWLIGTRFFLSFVMELLAFVVVPIALVGLKEEDNHLPEWARLWETYDNDINGDIYWKEEHAQGKERTYWWRLKWLIRNAAGTFSYEYLGFEMNNNVEFKLWGDHMTSNRAPAHSGFMYAEAWVDGKMYPCYYWVRQWGDTERCIRWYAGWKFRMARPVEDWKTEGQVSFVCGFNPLMGFVD